jgi:hypothetical protein
MLLFTTLEESQPLAVGIGVFGVHDCAKLMEAKHNAQSISDILLRVIFNKPCLSTIILTPYVVIILFIAYLLTKSQVEIVLGENGE